MDSEPRPFIRGWALNGGSACYKTRISIWFLVKKYAKSNLLMLIPLLKLVVCFSITDNKISTVYHIKEKMFKAKKRIDIIRKRNKSLRQYSFITIYKSFVRPHLGYGDIIYD